MRLRAVELEVAGTAEAAGFLERVWGLLPAGARGKVHYFRGTGDHPYVLSIAEAQTPSVKAITFAGSAVDVLAFKVSDRTRAIRSFDPTASTIRSPSRIPTWLPSTTSPSNCPIWKP